MKKTIGSIALSLLLITAMVGGCSTSHPVMTLSSFKSGLKTETKKMLRSPWYRTFAEKNNRLPILEVIYHGTSIPEGGKDVGFEGHQDHHPVPKWLSGAPLPLAVCIERVHPGNSFSWYQFRDAESFYQGYGYPFPSNKWTYWFDTRVIGSSHPEDIHLFKCVERENDRMKEQVALERNLSEIQKRAKRILEGYLVGSEKVRLVSVGRRSVLTHEREYAMEHGKSDEIKSPGHVTVADFIVILHRDNSLQLVDMSNNETVFMGMPE